MNYATCENQISDTPCKPGAIKSLLKDTTPAPAVLLLTIAYSFISGESVLSQSWHNVVITFMRLLRFTLMLCIPLYALPCIYRFVLRKRNHALLRSEVRGWETEINPVKHWLYRPLQGIGIGMLFGTKLLSVLQVIAGPVVQSSLLIPEGHFEAGRFIITTTITVLVSLALSTLWALDDTGIRYFNRKDHELKMIGKYVGTVMPAIFGFYGIFSLLANYSTGTALLYVCKTAIVLYPALTIFAVLHARFVRSRRELFLTKNVIKTGGVWQDK